MSDVPEMVTRVAKAIEASLKADGCQRDDFVGSVCAEFDEDDVETGEMVLTVDGKVRLHTLARAAIAAMREPSEAMRYAAWADQYEFSGGTADEARALATKRLEDESQRRQDMRSWSAAIDTALTAPAVPPRS